LGIRHSPRPLWGDRFFNGSGAWRGEIVKVCLQTMRLFENEFGVGAERGLRSRRKPHPSCPDLIRASINLRNDLFRRRWITGSSSPVMTISMGMTVCRGAATRPSQIEERRRMRQVVVEARRVARLSIRSAHLTIFWHCGHRYFSFRTGLGSVFPATNRQWFWPKMRVPKGLAMLIRSQMYGVQRRAANAVRPDALPAASLPTLLLGGLLLLIGP
jgi:hypothetical protein